MVIMVKTVQMNAGVRMELYVISELDHVTVQLDGWDNSATQVYKLVLIISLVSRLPILLNLHFSI